MYAEEDEGVALEEEEDGAPIAMLQALASLLGQEEDDEPFSLRNAMIFVRQLVGAASNNSAMVESLEALGSIRSEQVLDAFTQTDRAYFLEPYARIEDGAYADLPIHVAPLHQSAPSVYASVLEALQLEHGDSFLNIGSGSGYLSAIAARIIGPEAYHVGIESRLPMVQAARTKFSRVGNDSFWPEMADKLKKNVTFIHGDCYSLDTSENSFKFNKIYVGAGARLSARRLFRLLKEDGILVGPFENEDQGQNLIIVRARGGGAYSITPGESHVNFAWLVSDQDHNPLNTTTANEIDQISHRSTKSGLFSQQRITLPGPIWTRNSISQFPPAFLDRVRLLCRISNHTAPIIPAEIWKRHILAYLPANCFDPIDSRPCTFCGNEPSPGKTYAKCLRCCDCRFCSQQCQKAAYLLHLESSCANASLNSQLDATNATNNFLTSRNSDNEIQEDTTESLSTHNDTSSTPRRSRIRMRRHNPVFDSWVWDDFDDDHLPSSSHSVYAAGNSSPSSIAS